jgi:hypothetical protein
VNSAQRHWPFIDPRNTAVFTSVRIVDKKHWVHYVTHDEEDGAWQFHAFGGPANEKDVAVVSLEHMLRIEPLVRVARRKRRSLEARTETVCLSKPIQHRKNESGLAIVTGFMACTLRVGLG